MISMPRRISETSNYTDGVHALSVIGIWAKSIDSNLTVYEEQKILDRLTVF
jgi:hypothetical protein